VDRNKNVDLIKCVIESNHQLNNTPISVKPEGGWGGGDEGQADMKHLIYLTIPTLPHLRSK